MNDYFTIKNVTSQTKLFTNFFLDSFFSKIENNKYLFYMQPFINVFIFNLVNLKQQNSIFNRASKRG